MTESLRSILGTYDQQEPPVIAQIKQFVKHHVGETPSVTIHQTSISIGMPTAASAGALRMCLHELQEQITQPKKLYIRID